MTDGELHDNVLDALHHDTRIDASGIEVAVRNGVVSLNGRVRSYAEKMIAAGIVVLLANVRDVEEDLGISRPLHSRPTDSEVAARVEASLRRMPVCHHEIHVTVRRGRVTLKGCVSNWPRAAIAEAKVNRLPGVIGVDNLLTIRSAGQVRGTDNSESKASARQFQPAGRGTIGHDSEGRPLNLTSMGHSRPDQST
jgi:osmotically-inducible protein OsmY